MDFNIATKLNFRKRDWHLVNSIASQDLIDILFHLNNEQWSYDSNLIPDENLPIWYAKEVGSKGATTKMSISKNMELKPLKKNLGLVPS